MDVMAILGDNPMMHQKCPKFDLIYNKFLNNKCKKTRTIDLNSRHIKNII
jgi:hypothetical protein